MQENIGFFLMGWVLSKKTLGNTGLQSVCGWD